MGTVLFIISILIITAMAVVWVLSRTIRDEIRPGDKIHVYMEVGSFSYRHNRIVTVNSINDEYITIYETLSLSIVLSTWFYAVGYTSDDIKLIFVKKKRYLWPALFNEMRRNQDYDRE